MVILLTLILSMTIRKILFICVIKTRKEKIQGNKVLLLCLLFHERYTKYNKDDK